jgi:hypothetical protein
MDDILFSFFHTLYIWTVAFLSPPSISFVDFLVRFSIHNKVFPFVYFQCTYGRLTLSIKLNLLIKKN